jgi:hypothetical protein
LQPPLQEPLQPPGFLSLPTEQLPQAIYNQSVIVKINRFSVSMFQIHTHLLLSWNMELGVWNNSVPPQYQVVIGYSLLVTQITINI